MKIFTGVILLLLFSCSSTDDNGVAKGAKEIQLNHHPPEIQALYTEVKKYPDSISLRLKLAMALDSISIYKEALQQVDTLIQKDTGNSELWYIRGHIAEDVEDTMKAIESYDRALKIYPSADALLSLANLYAEQKNKNALIICKQVKQLALGREYDANSAFIEGVYHARTGDRVEATKFFDECIADNYTYMPAYIEKGLLYFDDKQYQDALKVFHFASTVNRLDANPYYWQGRCYERMNVKDSAILSFKKSLQLEDAPETREALKRVEAD